MEHHSQLNYTHSQPPPSYWDNLSQISLTKRALKELNRRNNHLNKSHSQSQRLRRPLTRSLLAEWNKDQRTISEILSSYSEHDFKRLQRFSRFGGIDLSDLRGYSEPVNPLEHSTMPPKNEDSTSRNKDALQTVTTGPYSRNFEQLLIDYGVFPAFYTYPDGRKPSKPKNLGEIKERLKQPRPSLSPSQFTDEEFEKFQEAGGNAKKEDQVLQLIIPIIEGKSRATKHVCGKIKFGNLQSLVDSTEPYTFVPGNPDLYDGARSEQLNRRIRETLKKTIIPTTQDDLPMAPNFFLHVKGRDGTEAVALRQAVYDGALGERGQLSLRSYGQKELHFDNNAHTIVSVFLHSMLTMYTIYTARTEDSSSRQEYYMHFIGSWAVNGDIESFRNGAAAFRNLRDWAKEKRDEAIMLANSVVEQFEGGEHGGGGHGGEEHRGAEHRDEEYPGGEHPEEEHPEEEHPEEEHPEEEHPEEEHPEGEHPEGEHPEGEHPEGEHPEEEHPGKKYLGEEDTELGVNPNSTLRVPNDDDSNNGQSSSPAKRPSSASESRRPLKRATIKR